MLTFCLVDRARYPDVPDEFFEAVAEEGLVAGLHAIEEAVLPVLSCEVEGELLDFLDGVGASLRQVAASRLQVFCLRVEPRTEIEADVQARDYARFIELLSLIERRMGGEGLVLLGLEAETPADTRELLRSPALRQLLEG